MNSGRDTTTPAAQPTHLSVEGAGVGLRAYDYGNASAPPVVLVHGIEDFSASLAPMAQALCAHYHVVAYDLRGHGDSGKPGVYTMPHHLADLHGLIEQLVLERPILVGHSLGGQIASRYAAVFSDLPAALVSVEGLGPPIRPSELAQRQQARFRSGIEGLLRTEARKRAIADLERAGELFRTYHPRLDRERARHLVEAAVEPHADGGWQWKWDPSVRTTWLSVDHRATEELWGWIECPVLLVTAGLAGEFWSRRRGVEAVAAHIDPEELKRRIGLFRTATHVEIAEAGHMVHYDAPDRVVEVIREFLGSHVT